MDLFLDRFSYAPTETEGEIQFASYTLATMERPWIPHIFLGGKPFQSCVPDGEYLLSPFERENGEDVYVLSNSDLGVYTFQGEMLAAKKGGRYACLLHTANFPHQVVGCIAPGLKRTLLYNKVTGSFERAVASSNEAMRILRSVLGSGSHRLVIRPKVGAGGITS